MREVLTAVGGPAAESLIVKKARQAKYIYYIVKGGAWLAYTSAGCNGARDVQLFCSGESLSTNAAAVTPTATDLVAKRHALYHAVHYLRYPCGHSRILTCSEADHGPQGLLFNSGFIKLHLTYAMIQSVDYLPGPRCFFSPFSLCGAILPTGRFNPGIDWPWLWRSFGEKCLDRWFLRTAHFHGPYRLQEVQIRNNICRTLSFWVPLDLYLISRSC